MNHVLIGTIPSLNLKFIHFVFVLYIWIIALHDVVIELLWALSGPYQVPCYFDNLLYTCTFPVGAFSKQDWFQLLEISMVTMLYNFLNSRLVEQKLKELRI